MTLTRMLLWAGIVSPLWIVVGVTIAGFLFPDYNHYHQALSELGATGSATQIISPAINNYPLGVLFILFGIGIFKSVTFTAAKFTALLIIIHGLGSIAAGYFPCDFGCQPDIQSLNQQRHNIAGMAMFISLLLACSIWIFIAHRVFGTYRLAIFSACCALAGIISFILMVWAVRTGDGLGFYQRINYGSSLIWLLGLAISFLKTSVYKTHSNNLLDEQSL